MLPRLSLILAVACASAAYGQDSFTKSLSPADFQAAGLSKLTPEELAALDALVEGRQTGAIAKAKEETKVETAKVVAEQVRQQVTQEVRQQVTQEVTQKVKAEDQQAEQKKAASAGIIEKLRVVLKPGTEIEYTAMDAVLLPPFEGWEKGTVFTLTNGQRWVVTDENQYWAPRRETPIHVRIEPGFVGSFFMEIEKGGRPRVKFLDNGGAKAPAAP